MLPFQLNGFFYEPFLVSLVKSRSLKGYNEYRGIIDAADTWDDGYSYGR